MLTQRSEQPILHRSSDGTWEAPGGLKALQNPIEILIGILVNIVAYQEFLVRALVGGTRRLFSELATLLVGLDG